jgi:hypothetical protein
MPSHSELSASAASRWMNCPASVRLSYGIASTDNVYTSEGTAAHELAAKCLQEDREAAEFIGQTINESTVTSAMADSVQIYVDHCRRLADSCDLHFIEHRISLELLSPPVPMYGTADFIGYYARRRELHAVDLKFGKGVWVAAKDNPQVRYYALGAALAIDGPVSKVVATIVQPRFGKAEPIRTVVLDAIELAEWSFELMKHAHATRDPEAPTVPGDWCKFCPAKGSCLAHQLQRANTAFHEFTLADARAAGA